MSDRFRQSSEKLPKLDLRETHGEPVERYRRKREARIRAYEGAVDATGYAIGVVAILCGLMVIVSGFFLFGSIVGGLIFLGFLGRLTR